MRSIALFAAACLFASGCSTGPGVAGPDQTEILWDTWGVPHIYGRDAPELFRAFGWAQMHAHGNVILELYGQAGGRAAEFWGERYVDSDRWVRTMGIPARARRWHAEQSPEFRRCLDAFAAGMNEYARTFPERLDPDLRVILPIEGDEVLAHTQRVVHFGFVASPFLEVAAQRALQASGSNAWAIAPERADSGHAMLLANPHLRWSGDHLFYEAHLVAPGVDIYGTTLIGFPVLLIAFNERLGWTHTVNTYDGADGYELELSGDGYQFDGEVRKFDVERNNFQIKREDGTRRWQTLLIRRSVHGPVIAERGERAVALRVAGLDAPGMLEEWWQMGCARSLAEFEEALARLQVPMFNTLYADADGHILYVFNGRVPVRVSGDVTDWEGLVPGTSSENLWTEVHPYDDLPRLLDPESGWVQNANDPPWTATHPPALDPAGYAEYMAPSFMHFRAQQSARMLAEDEEISFEELLEYKHSTEVLLADRLLDDLLPAARRRGGEVAGPAADVLATWDRRTDAHSEGAVLFLEWLTELSATQTPAGLFAVPWDPADPLATPDGLADPEAAVEALERVARRLLNQHGNLDVAWGEVNRLRYGGHDLPGNGGPGDPGGIFRTAYYAPDSDGTPQIVAGDTFYMAVEFGSPVRARVLTAYGNATQPGSPHRGDQLPLFARQEMRPAWLTREEIEANLESRTDFQW